VAALVGCGGTGAQGKTALAAAASEQNGIKIDSVDVFSQTANAMVRVPYSELRFEFGESSYPSLATKLEVIGMTDGAVAAYFFRSIYDGWSENREPPPIGWEPLEVKLDNEEYSTFFKALHNSGIRQWRRNGYYSATLDGHGWGFDIYTKSGDTLISSWGNNNYPPDDEWSAFNNVINGFIKMMKEKKQKLREMEYIQRFGKPMSEYERSIVKILYDYGTTRLFSVELKASGEIILFDSCFVRLNIADWLDIINALDNIGSGSINKNNVDTTEMKDTLWKYIVSVYDSAGWRNRLVKNKEFVDTVKPLHVSEKLKNIMDGISAGITCEE
jgi:hypothetical protein